jgi:hypothetical protein
MCALVALKEGENELRAIVTAVRTKCLRGHRQLADQNARRCDHCDKITPPHEYPRSSGRNGSARDDWTGRAGMSAFCHKRTSRLLRTSVTLAVMFIWRVCVRHEIGVWIAPAPIASQNIRPALLNRAILAVPVHAAIAVIHHGAPRRGVGLSRLQTNRAYGSNSNDGDENRAHQILVSRFRSQVNCPLGQQHLVVSRYRWRSHSITSSARLSSVSGTVRPSALAVLRLIASSIFVGCSTGRSAGFAPFKILSTYAAERR